MLWTVKTCAGLLAMAVVAGCGGSDSPDLGYVEGTVTLDGKPLNDVVLTFQPQNARPSYGRTDEDGYYELIYTDDNPGATIGTHLVRISAADAASGEASYEAGNAGGGGPARESIPAKYNVMSKLEKDVKAGDQVIDFELESGGAVIQQNDAEDAY